MKQVSEPPELCEYGVAVYFITLGLVLVLLVGLPFIFAVLAVAIGMRSVNEVIKVWSEFSGAFNDNDSPVILWMIRILLIWLVGCIWYYRRWCRLYARQLKRIEEQRQVDEFIERLSRTP